MGDQLTWVRGPENRSHFDYKCLRETKGKKLVKKRRSKESRLSQKGIAGPQSQDKRRENLESSEPPPKCAGGGKGGGGKRKERWTSCSKRQL